MKKGLVTTGIAMLIGITLIASVNYLVLGKQDQNKANVVKMKIDAVNNRHQDVQWVIKKSVDEAYSNSGTCQEFYNNVQNYFDTAFNSEHKQGIWNTGKAKLTQESHNVDNGCMENSQSGEVNVTVSYTVKNSEETIQKSEVFEESYFFTP